VSAELSRDLGLRTVFEPDLDVISLVESQLSIAHRPLSVAVEERMRFRRLAPLFGEVK
jgi:hypothetical protein